MLDLYRRFATPLLAACLAATAVVAHSPRAQAEACQLGEKCSFDVTNSVDIPGLGNVTDTMPVSVDLTDLKPDGSGKVGVATPDVSTTTDTKSKEIKVSRKGNGKTTRRTVKNDKSVKEAKVKISKSKNRRGS